MIHLSMQLLLTRSDVQADNVGTAEGVAAVLPGVQPLTKMFGGASNAGDRIVQKHNTVFTEDTGILRYCD